MAAIQRQIFNERIHSSFQKKVVFGLFIFDSLIQFGNTKLKPLYFPTDTDLVEHLPVLGFTKNTKLYTANKDSGIHDLQLSLVRLEKFDSAKDSSGYKRQGV